MNVYDFDNTIFRGDSTAKFYFYCLVRYPKMVIHLPATALAGLKFLMGIYTKTRFKETLYRFLRCVPNVEGAVASFWDKQEKNIKDWYFLNHRDDDVVISASPEFLLDGICKKLRVEKLMASRVDPKTGLYNGENCHGAEKVRRFREIYESQQIEEFYSDSRSDTPLAEISLYPFLVSGNRIEKW